MSSTNHTPNYNLPQFVASDKPAWLTDVNSAMNTIDTEMKNNNNLATGASTSASNAVTTAENAMTLATEADNKADANTTAIETINDKIGNVAETLNRLNTGSGVTE